MVQVYAFEQQEQRLYLESGAKTRLEPFLLSLFWSQISDGPATYALLMLKWWARLHFVLNSSHKKQYHNSSPSVAQPGNYFFHDYFDNSSQERAIQYLFIHYLQKEEIIRPLNFSASTRKEFLANSVNTSSTELIEAMKLLLKFFYHLLFDFDIKLVINAVPINTDGLHKIYAGNLKVCQKGLDHLKIIYFSRNKAKSSWLHLSPECTQSMFKQVADSLQALNKQSASDECLSSCFLPTHLCTQMESYIEKKLSKHVYGIIHPFNSV